MTTAKPPQVPVLSRLSFAVGLYNKTFKIPKDVWNARQIHFPLLNRAGVYRNLDETLVHHIQKTAGQPPILCQFILHPGDAGLLLTNHSDSSSPSRPGFIVPVR